MQRISPIFFMLLGAIVLVPRGTQAQESSPEIELGSSRIGGPGLTEAERRRVRAEDQDDGFKTETNIPPPGNKKRLPHLHYLARKYVNGKAFKDACEKYDTIFAEGGMTAIEADEYGKKNAARAYFACGKIAYAAAEYEKAEKLLAMSERYGPTTPRHLALRLKMKRDEYRKRLANGDVNGALKLFNEAQQENEDEDERIWMGEQLATMAWAAYKGGDKYRTDDLMRKIESVAPMNTEYRKLKDILEAQTGMLGQLLMVAGIAIGAVVLWNIFAAWRARARLKLSSNPFDDDL